MKEQDYNLNYSTERPTNSEEGDPKTSKKQKCLIFLSLSVALIIIAAAIILYILLFSKSKDFDGEIYCIYDIKNISKEIFILGENFKKLSSLDIIYK